MATLGVPNKSPVNPAPASAPESAAPAAPELKNDLVRLAPTPELNPRVQAMREISERSNADANIAAAEKMDQVDDNGNVFEPDPNTAPPEQLAEGEGDVEFVDANAALQYTETVAPVAPSNPNANPNEKQFDKEATYDLIVDGKVVKFKGSQIIERGQQALQKETAADYRLEQASRLLAEAKLAASTAPQLPQGATQQPVQQQQPNHISDEQLAEMVQFGTKEQAAQAIAMVRNSANPAANNEAIIRQLMERMPKVASDQLAFSQGVEFVKTEYKDLLEDPYLKPLFMMKENQMRQAGDTRAYTDIYKQIGEELRSHFNRPKPTGTTVSAAKTMEEKVAAKAAAPSAPKLASARMEAGAPPKPATREEIIAKMQRQRGQAAMH